MAEIDKFEADRRFCRHGITHLFDVARLAYIERLEKGLDIPKEQIYAAALLHDIGRCMEYGKSIPHEAASAELSGTILSECGFSESEADAIISAIIMHKVQADSDDDSLRGLIYRADKRSRLCFCCAAESDCYWSSEKKNMTITY